jgi:hypothetical protein
MIDLPTGSAVSQAISVAAKLGVADHLGDGPRAAGELAEAVGAHPTALYRLLRLLGEFGVFAELEGRRFGLTPLSELLRGDAEGLTRLGDDGRDALASRRLGSPARGRQDRASRLRARPREAVLRLPARAPRRSSRVRSRDDRDLPPGDRVDRRRLRLRPVRDGGRRRRRQRRPAGRDPGGQPRRARGPLRAARRGGAAPGC